MGSDIFMEAKSHDFQRGVTFKMDHGIPDLARATRR